MNITQDGENLRKMAEDKLNRRNEKLVYKVTNIINGKSYIGWCIDFKERKARHIKEAKKGTKTHFYNALRKYGESAFIWSILYENLDSYKTCKEVEKQMIKEYNTYHNGYNSTLGGDGGYTGPNSGQFKKNCVPWNKGIPATEEHIQKLKNADRTKSHIPVLQFDLNSNFIREWFSIKEAVNTLKISNHISAVCKGKRKTCGGYIWKYKN